MRGWNALAVWFVITWSVVGCGGSLDGSEIADSGGTGGSSGTGSGGTGGSAGDDAGPPPPPPPSPCTRNEDCDDALYCNGRETCVNRVCAAGVAPTCDDGVTCTIDRCLEDRHECASLAPDADGDGHRDATCLDDLGDVLGDDCDDSDSTSYPGALEVCDADDHDEDCDLTTFGRVDADGDGYMNGNCCNVQDDASLLCGDDCDDSNGRIHPFNTESCDGYDNDCNGLLDHPQEDRDGDGFATTACGGTDCDDSEPMTFAGAMERCDGFDNDCIQGGGVAADETDQDSDTFVSGVCMKMDDVDLSPGDCDEDRPSANPMRDELCNGRDDDCDGAIDEGSMDCSHAVKQVDANYVQTCAVRVNGTVACWGRNDSGFLGTGADTTILDYPRSVLDPRDPSHLLSNVHTVAVGTLHACAVHLDGRVSCWGYNIGGSLGTGSTESGVSLPSAASGIEGAAQACAGDNFACVREDNGTIACWGANYRGQLGDGTRNDRAVPAALTSLNGSVDLDCNASYACAVTQDGGVRCWGYNGNGQLGDVTTVSSNTPVAVIGVTDAVQVTTARDHACARLRDGTARCWGDNTYGQRGVDSVGGGSPASALLYFTGEPVDDIVEIFAGGGDVEEPDAADDAAHTCVRLRDGRVMCVGSNLNAQLGYGEVDDDTDNMAPPRALSARYPVQGLNNAIRISLGHQHACALVPDGTLHCWGDGGSGQLPGHYGWAITPRLIEGL